MRHYIEALFNTAYMAFITLADLESYVRIAGGFIGIILSCFTIYKIYLDVKKRRYENEMLKEKIKQNGHERRADS